MSNGAESFFYTFFTPWSDRLYIKVTTIYEEEMSSACKQVTDRSLCSLVNMKTEMEKIQAIPAD